MGLSASQARLLTLTARLSDLELQAQQISNSKIRLSMKTAEIAENYADALDKTELSIISGTDANGNDIYEELNYYNLTGVNSPLTAQYCLSDQSGRILVTQAQARAFERSDNVGEFIDNVGGGRRTSPNPPTTPPPTNLDDLWKVVTTTLATLDDKGNKYIDGYEGSGKWKTSTKTNVLSYKKSKIDNFLTESLGGVGSAMPSAAVNNFAAGTSVYLNSHTPGVKDFSYSGIGNNTDQFIFYHDSTYKADKYGNDATVGNQKLDSSNAAAKVALNDLINNIGMDITSAMANQGLKGFEPYMALALTRVQNKYANYIDQSSNNVIEWDNKANNEKEWETNFDTVRNSVAGQRGVSQIRDNNGNDKTCAYAIDISEVINTILECFDEVVFDGESAKNSNVLLYAPESDDRGVYIEGEGHESTTAEKLAKITEDGNDNSGIPFLDGTYHAQKMEYKTAWEAWQAAIKAYENAGGEIDPPDGGDHGHGHGHGADYSYYENLYYRMCEGYFTMNNEADTINSAAWIQAQMQSGNLVLEKFTTDQSTGLDDWISTEFSSTGDIKEQNDDDAAAKAEAVYDSEMAKIEVKDKEYDLRLKNIDTEHNAVQTEIDTVQKVIDKNIQRSFKLFQA